jgi:hypothetical protein
MLIPFLGLSKQVIELGTACFVNAASIIPVVVKAAPQSLLGWRLLEAWFVDGRHFDPLMVFRILVFLS